MIGEVLRREREKQKLTINDVVNATSIRALYIESIEKGDYGVLPGDVYTRGFIKNYARFLGIDAAACVQAFNSEIGKVSPRQSAPAEANKKTGILGGRFYNQHAQDQQPQRAQRQQPQRQQVQPQQPQSRSAQGQQPQSQKSQGIMPPTWVRQAPANRRQQNQPQGQPMTGNRSQQPQRGRGPVRTPSGDFKRRLAASQRQQRKLLLLIGTIVVIVLVVAGLLFAFSGSSDKSASESSATIETSAKADVATGQLADKTDAAVTPAADGVEVTATFGDDCWTEVEIDGKPSFEGIVAKGKTMTWKGKQKINIYVGNSSVVDFTCNGKKLGKLGKGDTTDYTFTPQGQVGGTSNTAAANTNTNTNANTNANTTTNTKTDNTQTNGQSNAQNNAKANSQKR